MNACHPEQEPDRDEEMQTHERVEIILNKRHWPVCFALLVEFDTGDGWDNKESLFTKLHWDIMMMWLAEQAQCVKDQFPGALKWIDEVVSSMANLQVLESDFATIKSKTLECS